MGLKFSEDLAAWQKWAEKQNLARYLAHRLRRKTEDRPRQFAVLRRGSDAPKVLVALEATSPTQIAALLEPAKHLEELGVPVAVVTLVEHRAFLEARGYQIVEEISDSESMPDSLKEVKQVIAAGHYLPVGSWVFVLAQRQGWTFNVVQHGLNTPFAPPLPANSRLFAFSPADAEFWISGRSDIQAEVVGAQIFFEALQKPPVDDSKIAETPIFLGQMHGAELSRASFARASYKFCQNHGAIYRPHPSEKDKLSTMTHKLWAKWGVTIDSSKTPLNELNNPVVSVFSTGVLEAAIRGIPAWVYHPNPPEWLLEFWNRYGLSQWGSEPTAPPVAPETEPAQKIARIIADTLEN